MLFYHLKLYKLMGSTLEPTFFCGSFRFRNVYFNINSSLVSLLNVSLCHGSNPKVDLKGIVCVEVEV